MSTAFRVRVGGMTCAGCAASVEREVAALEGVREATVNYATGVLTAWPTGDGVAPSAVAERVRSAGYVVLSERPGMDDERALALLKVRLAVAVFFSMNAMLPAIAVYLGVGAPTDSQTAWWLGLVTGALSVPVVFFSGWSFLAGTWRSLRAREPGMDLLVSCGALATFAYSGFVLATGRSEVYFDTASGIVTFLLMGQLVEHLVRRRSLDAVQLITRLVPEHAHVLNETATGVEDLATERVGLGARVEIRTGERAPLDGTVITGQALVDASLLTGESAGQRVRVGDRIEAGSLVLDGTVTIEVTAVTGARAVDFIATKVDDLLGRRAPLQALADRVASRLTVVVLAAACITALGVWWWSGSIAVTLTRAVSVAVVACPCALGLATPMAVLVAAGKSATRGILFRDAAVFEQLAAVDRLLFDKTGTLTVGRPTVAEVVAASQSSESEVLAVAARAESGSSHPIARAILEAAGRPVAAETSELTTVPGEGVVLRANEGTIRVGRAELVGVPRWAASESHVWSEAHVSLDDVWLGVVRVGDVLREEAPAAVAAFRERRIRLAIVSGDLEPVTRAVGASVGIDEIHASCRPLDKVRLVEEASAAGSVVAFVGDGLNDAAALGAAAVGIAVTDATDIARAAAGVVLRSGGLERVVDAVDLARRTRRVMRQNVGWAILYNAVAVPAAAMGFVSPPVAALAMALSSVSVVASSLRLAR